MEKELQERRAYLISIKHEMDNLKDVADEIQRLKDQNRRDDALDMIRFCRENQSAKKETIEELEQDLRYTAVEKMKALILEGAIMGKVQDFYLTIPIQSSQITMWLKTKTISK